MELAAIPAEFAEAADQPHVAVVLRLRRALGGVDMLGIAAAIGCHACGRHAGERLVPVDGIVTAGFPRMQDGDQSALLGVAAGIEPAVPGVGLGGEFQRHAARKVVIARFGVEPLDDEAQHGRLGDAGGRRRAVGAPGIGAREIAFVWLVEDDMRHHAVRPLMGEKRGDLGPGTALVEVALAEGGQAGIPVPLKRIEPLGGDRIGAAIVVAENAGGPVEKDLVAEVDGHDWLGLLRVL